MLDGFQHVLLPNTISALQCLVVFKIVTPGLKAASDERCIITEPSTRESLDMLKEVEGQTIPRASTTRKRTSNAERCSSGQKGRQAMEIYHPMPQYPTAEVRWEEATMRSPGTSSWPCPSFVETRYTYIECC